MDGKSWEWMTFESGISGIVSGISGLSGRCAPDGARVFMGLCTGGLLEIRSPGFQKLMKV